ncbi:hypothetical protein F511_36374 [Dorcoceras hygrometricum]|uniref:Uncharacterized protein n=1 Tax=Dorcoceras hygrometricum TaxID=472368 RepID=A0A2Z7BAA1_9LAMI|nr:hypothetical protein F511_36374 [Dorcoceras hygrometricum]
MSFWCSASERAYRVCVPVGCSAEADVNTGQHHCSARRKRRRLDVATGCPAARDLCATVASDWWCATVACSCCNAAFYMLRLVPAFGGIPVMFKPVVWLSSFWLRTSRRYCSTTSFCLAWFENSAVGSLHLLVCWCLLVMSVDDLTSFCEMVVKAGFMMPPRRRGRDRGQFEESAGQNEDRHSARSHTRVSDEEEEVCDLPPRVERMDVVIARFQRMNPLV